MKFNVEKLPSGNYLVHVIKGDKLLIERAYEEIGDVVSLLLTTLDPV